MWAGMFMVPIGSAHTYSAGSQDINSRYVASKLLSFTTTVTVTVTGQPQCGGTQKMTGSVV